MESLWAGYRLVPHFPVGSEVEVRTAEEILATLDSKCCFEELPFMPEMLAYCGKRFRVYKQVDKIIDMVNKTGLRRMSGTVLLEDIRCGGQAHGGCQAGCLLLWKEEWLRKPSRSAAEPVGSRDPARSKAALLGGTRKPLEESPDGSAYRCQATELFRATSYLPWWDIRQDLFPLWYRNITVKEFVSVVSIGLFNVVQRLRGGTEYPNWVGSRLKKTPTLSLNLQPGEQVRVRTKEEIQKTLDSHNRNRGLWFDHEMLKYCGGCFRVLRIVDRLVDERTGTLLQLQNPCVILDGVTSRGDFHRFYPQNDYLLWRHIWLQRV